ncbi:MAG: YcgN family cysteine cluster protein [Dongiaceae bacterium]
MADGDQPFWKTKTLGRMTQAEWESLCDGCGKCCLNKLIDADANELFFTNVACRLLDAKSCQCTRYKDRSKLVKDCVRLTPRNVKKIRWLPDTCAYRLVAEGKDLFDWHHLICGDRNEVHRAGASVRGRTISETDAGELENHLVDWVGAPPRKRTAKR